MTPTRRVELDEVPHPGLVRGGRAERLWLLFPDFLRLFVLERGLVTDRKVEVLSDAREGDSREEVRRAGPLFCGRRPVACEESVFEVDSFAAFALSFALALGALPCPVLVRAAIEARAGGR